jgi:thiol-disulfide isomerase/thioredoxin
MDRRNLLYSGVAAAAGLAGVGAAWMKNEPQKLTPVQTNAAEDALWALSFDTPDSQPQAMSKFRGKPLLLNFWATWCPPCIEELPMLDAFYQQHKAEGWQVMGLAVDQPSAVRKWLQSKPLSFPVGMAGFSGTDLSKTLGNPAGSLPFTAVFGAAGSLLHRKTGKLSKEELEQWAQLK